MASRINCPGDSRKRGNFYVAVAIVDCHRRGEGTDGQVRDRGGGWQAGEALLKVAARKKGRSRSGERVRLHAQPRYEVSLRAISNGLHWASANIKFDVHDYCGPPGEICGGAGFAGCGE